MKTFDFKIIISEQEDGKYLVEAPEIPGCHSEGKTLDEAKQNIKEAIELCLKVAKDDEVFAKEIDWPSKKNSSKFFGIFDLTVQSPFAFQ